MNREQLIRYGKCCGNGCIFCPFYPQHEKDATRLFKGMGNVDCPPKFRCSSATALKGHCLCYEDKNPRT